MSGQAPQHEIPALDLRCRLLSDDGKGESKRRRPIAVSFRLDLVKPASFEFAQKTAPAPLKGRREGGGARQAWSQASVRFGHPCRWLGAWEGALGVDCRARPGNDEGGRKRTGGVGRGRAQCGGIGQRHGNLLERANLRA